MAQQGITLGQLIDTHEGGGSYSTLFGHSQREGGRFAGVDPSQMTIGEALEFANPSGDYGQWVKGELGRSGQRARVATPMGKYQIVGTTLRNASGAMGLDPNAPFDATTQDQIAGHLAQQRLANAKSPAAKRAAMRAEWEGFKHVSNADLDAAIADFERTGQFGTEGGGQRGPTANPDGSISRGYVGISGDAPIEIRPDGSIGQEHAGVSGGGAPRSSYQPKAGVGQRDTWSKKRDEEGKNPEWFEGRFGKMLGLNEGGARDKLMAGLGMDKDGMKGIGGAVMGLGQGIGNMRF